MNVPLLDLRAQFKQIEEDVRSAIEGVLQSQLFILGETVHRFEEKIAAYCEAPHAVGCASGSDALQIALMALDVGPGDEVITSPFSFYASTSYIVRLGAKPVFADIDPRTFNIDPDGIAAAVTKRTKAIMPVHLFGQCAEMGGIMEIAERHGLPVVEDAAQAIGSRFDGRPAGSIGTIGCFSFFPSKNLGAYGDGGMMITADSRLADRLRTLRVHGEREKYVHHEIGINSRLDALQAAVLGAKLPYLDGWSDARSANARNYNRLFRECGLAPETIETPYDAGVENKRHRHIYNQYTIKVKNRDSLSAHLRDNGIGHAVYYPVPLYLQPCFSFLGFEKGLCPETEKAAEEVISLPIYPELTKEQIEAVVRSIAEFYK
jgi:dTDP-4-amino-4,6-dideoxygalactose transaminase